MALIEECGPNIPGNTMAGFERLRCAALKISGGDSAKLHAAIDLAKIDFRDMLMWANCANDVEAHLKWLPEQTW